MTNDLIQSIAGLAISAIVVGRWFYLDFKQYIKERKRYAERDNTSSAPSAISADTTRLRAGLHEGQTLRETVELKKLSGKVRAARNQVIV